MSQIWDRQEDESEKAYSAFQHYLAMAPGHRTVKGAHDAYQIARGVPEKAVTTVNPNGYFWRWHARFAWKDRAKAYDDHQLQVRMAATEDSRKELIIKSWDALGRILDIQLDSLGEATFDERTRLLNSLRENIKTFHIQDPAEISASLHAIFEVGVLRK